MKQGIVKFSKEFVTEIGTKEWVGLELSFDMDSESAVTVLARAETIVNEYQRPKSYIMQYNMPYQTQSTPTGELPDERQPGLTPELIMSCSDLTTLQSFYLLVKGSNRVDLKEAYDQRKNELVKRETDELFEATEAFSEKLKAKNKK